MSSRIINEKMAFLSECQAHRQKVQAHREQVAAQHMGHMARVLASKEAYRQYRRTGNSAEIMRLKKLGVWVDTPL